MFGEPVPASSQRGPSRPILVPERRLPEKVIDATVHKHRENNRVVAMEKSQVFGSPEPLEEDLAASTASRRVNTSFVERQNASDCGRNARNGGRRTASERTGRSMRR